ncbi:MAG: hypothetical protein AAF617_14190 [Bacteroidota bacterium]
MEQEHLHDPFRFEYESSTRRFSIRTKILAIVLVLIFFLIPLYEISPETFKASYIEIPADCPETLNCGCYGFYMPSLPELFFGIYK